MKTGEKLREFESFYCEVCRHLIDRHPVNPRFLVCSTGCAAGNSGTVLEGAIRPKRWLPVVVKVYKGVDK